MRIIDKEVTGKELDLLANEFFADLNPIANSASTKLYNGQFPAGKLEKVSKIEGLNEQVDYVAKELYDNMETLFVGRPEQLLMLHNHIEDHLNDEFLSDLEILQNLPDYRNHLAPIFNYYETSFRSNARGVLERWFDKLNLNVCPYCNQHWVLAHEIVDQNGQTSKSFLFDLDHYFPRNSYPFFSLSFYNLIPSCTLCNQRIKGKDAIVKHVHPYIDDMDKAITFDAQVTTSALFYSKTASIDLTIKRRKYVRLELFEKARETYEFFQIEERYQNHEDYVRELMQKNVKYSARYIDYMWKKGQGTLFNTRDEVVRMVAGNYTLSKDIHKRPLAKLAKDILTIA